MFPYFAFFLTNHNLCIIYVTESCCWYELWVRKFRIWRLIMSQWCDELCPHFNVAYKSFIWPDLKVWCVLHGSPYPRIHCVFILVTWLYEVGEQCSSKKVHLSLKLGLGFCHLHGCFWYHFCKKKKRKKFKFKQWINKILKGWKN